MGAPRALAQPIRRVCPALVKHPRSVNELTLAFAGSPNYRWARRVLSAWA